MSKCTPRPRMSAPRWPAARAASIACVSRAQRDRVLAPHVEVAAFATGGEPRDRHRFDQRERIVLDEHSVLERARFALVGVGDQEVGERRMGRDRLPLASRRERRRRPAQQGHSSRLHRPPPTIRSRPPCATRRTPRARRYDSSEPGSTTPARPSNTSPGSPRSGHRLRRVPQALGQRRRERRLARFHDKGRRRPFAQPQARRRMALDLAVRRGYGARDVFAHVHDAFRALLQGEQ